MAYCRCREAVNVFQVHAVAVETDRDFMCRAENVTDQQRWAGRVNLRTILEVAVLPSLRTPAALYKQREGLTPLYIILIRNKERAYRLRY
jgi:hypothetical protein